MTTAPPSLTRIGVALEHPIARISLKNPNLNIIDFAMMDELATAFADIEAEPKLSTIVIRGEGEHFSVGVDIAVHTPGKVGTMLKKFHSVIRALVNTKKLTIGLVHGNCLGGGAELAMLCDIVITSEEATWGFPEISLGCFPPVAVTALSGIIGPKRANDMIMTGDTIVGAEASSIGLATRAVPQAQLDSALARTIESLQKKSPAAMAIAKKAIFAWDSINFDKGLARAEKLYLEELMKTDDAREGVEAFLEKRDPRWKGQ